MFLKLKAFFLLSFISVAISCGKGNGSGGTNPPPPANTFTNPLLPSGPDPWIIKKDNYYYYTNTLGNRIALWRTTKVSDLKNALIQNIWTAPAVGANSKNVWAPELLYDDIGKQFIIIWASTVPFRFEKGIEDENNNHRMYYTTTKDFKTFTETKLFLDPKFSVIDAVIVKTGKDKYVLVLKDNTRPERDNKCAFANNPLGPWQNISQPFTQKFTEGPAVAKVKDGYLIYYDVYQDKKFGASFTKDFKTFSKADSLISIPEGHKHGTISVTKSSVLKKIK